jgi:DinB family protein
MPRIKWVERQFNFNYPTGLYPEMIERLRGTPARVDEYLSSASPEILTARDHDRWSIQENAGHLLDLDALTIQRIDEFVAGATMLHAADMSNKKTHEANYNRISAATISQWFRQRRMEICDRLDTFEPNAFGYIAIHPRLNVPMRLVDLLFFQCEHDDYHLTRINELIKHFSRR